MSDVNPCVVCRTNLVSPEKAICDYCLWKSPAIWPQLVGAFFGVLLANLLVALIRWMLQ